MGLKFERDLRKVLPSSAEQSVWWEYVEERRRWAETDWIIPFCDEVAVLEVKLKRIDQAIPQVLKYSKIVAEALKIPARPIILVKSLAALGRVEKSVQLCESLEEALGVRGKIPLLQWIGVGPL
jgi:hypothetical protein